MASLAKRKKISTLHFEEFPDEILIEFMGYLSIKQLLRCMQVSKRFKALCQAESLWQKIDLSWRDEVEDVPYSFVQFVLDKKCKSLSLEDVVMYGKRLKLNKISQLKHLNLGGCQINERSRNDLLFSCQYLERLSLNAVNLPTHAIKSICLQNGKTLQKLDRSSHNYKLAPAYGKRFSYTWRNTQLKESRKLQFESIQDIVYNCVELTELNLAFISLCDDSLCCLANNLTPKILKLSLENTPIRDEHVKALVIRCNKITELDLSECDKITNMALTNINENLKSSLQKLALFSCWAITAGGRNLTSLYQLKSMPKLRISFLKCGCRPLGKFFRYYN